MKIFGNWIYPLLALLFATLALAFLGCAPSMSQLAHDNPLPVDTRDCQLPPIKIKYEDPMIVDVIGQLEKGPTEGGKKYVGLAIGNDSAGQIWIANDLNDVGNVFWHEMKHFCTENAAEDAELDARDREGRVR